MFITNIIELIKRNYMENTFNYLVNEIQKLPLKEKEELKFLIEKYLIEEKREKIFKNYKATLKEEKEKKLKFSSDPEELKKGL